MNLPNKLTILRLILVPVYVVLMLMSFPGHMLVALAIFCIASITDFLDGHIARKYHLVTNLGIFLDPVADKVLTLSAFILFVGAGTMPSWVAIIIVAREIVVTGFRMVAASKNVIIAAGIWGKSKTVLQMITIIILTLANWPFSLMGIPLDQILIYGTAAVTVLSGVEYIAKNTNVLKDDNEGEAD